MGRGDPFLQTGVYVGFRVWGSELFRYFELHNFDYFGTLSGFEDASLFSKGMMVVSPVVKLHFSKRQPVETHVT